MKLAGLVVIGAAVMLPAHARAQESITLNKLVGTWVGGPTDSSGTPQNGMTTSDTLILKSDSTFLWTRNGRRGMVNPQAPTDIKWKSLSNGNISWLGGPGFDLTLKQKKLSMVSAQANPQTGQPVYFAFSLIGPPPTGPLKIPASAQANTGGGNAPMQPVTPTPGNPACQVQIAPIGRVLPANMRAQSPLDSISFDVASNPVKVCYGRPSARGRTMIGGRNVPYGKLWRTGANEPTTINTPIPLTIAGVDVPAGVYSLYTIPGETEWEIILNKSISQWGLESMYTPEVKAQEVGRGKVKSEQTTTPVEQFTIRAEPVSGNPKAATLVLEWEETRVAIPVVAK